MNFADLHCHSTFSDGSFTPTQIVELAHQKGFKGVSLTDHDTTKGLPELFEAAKKYNLVALSGIEFSCYHKNSSVHLLGYGFNLHHPAITRLEDKHLERREARNHAMVEKLKSLGIEVNLAEIKTDGVVGRPHIALLMVKKGYVSNLQEAFQKFLGEGKAAFVEAFTITLAETIEAIHEANGYAILAHPHLIDSSELFNQLLKYPLDGLECYYSNFNRDQNERYIKKVAQKEWIATGGSDFHGENKPYVAYGASFTDENTFRKLCRTN